MISETIEFFFDEDIPSRVSAAVIQLEPSCQFHQVGIGGNTPPKQTLDHDVLLFASQHRYAVVTYDKNTMIDEAVKLVSTGGHTYGVFVFPNGHYMQAGRIAEELIFIWAASTKTEWIDRIVFLPLKSA